MNFPNGMEALGGACACRLLRLAPESTAFILQNAENGSERLLLGVESAMAMEAAIKQVAEARGGTVQLSRFANGWQLAFRDKARPDIVREIDEFYTQNPEQKKRHVFDVIWTEMVLPAEQATKEARQK